MERLEDERLELKQKIRKLAQHTGQRYMLIVGSFSIIDMFDHFLLTYRGYSHNILHKDVYH